jgi:hypothetical protein
MGVYSGILDLRIDSSFPSPVWSDKEMVFFAEVIVKKGNHENLMNPLPNLRILRGSEYGTDPCSAIQKIAAQNYGPSTALPVSMLRSWYKKNPDIFRIALTPKNAVAGYVSTLPLSGNMFNRSIDSDFQESSITADDIDITFFPTNGGVFISSIAVAPKYHVRSAASLLLRLALIEDLIAQCPGDKQRIRLSAQTLSKKGEACMKSLGLHEQGFTKIGWKVYYGKLGKPDLDSIQRELRRKYETRFKPAKWADFHAGCM